MATFMGGGPSYAYSAKALEAYNEFSDNHNDITFYKISLAGAEGLEPTTLGFGDRCSTN